MHKVLKICLLLVAVGVVLGGTIRKKGVSSMEKEDVLEEGKRDAYEEDFPAMENWIDDLPCCKEAGTGFQTNQKYQAGYGRRELHEREDRSFHVKFPCSKVSLYGVFDGHDSARVAHFAAQKIPADLLFDGEIADSSELIVKTALRNAFLSVDSGYLELINEDLVQRTNLQVQIPEGLSSYEVYQRYPLLVSRLQELDREIQGGASAAICLLQDNNLYIASVGDVRAVLCTKNVDGSLHMEQLSVDHNIKNDQELQRLANIGMDIEMVQKTGRIFNRETTRSLGDFRLKGGYKEIECLRSATSEPIISEPFLAGSIKVEESFYFLAIFTRGFYEALEEISGSKQVNKDIIALIAAELNEQSTIGAVAQSVVDKVCRAHQEEFINSDGATCQEREDITLLVRLFSARLGKKSTPVTPPIHVSEKHAARLKAKSPTPMPVTVPYTATPTSVSEEQFNKLPRLIMPTNKHNLPSLGSLSQPNSRVSTPVTLLKTASTPPCLLYRNLSHVSEESAASNSRASLDDSDDKTCGSCTTLGSTPSSVQGISPLASTIRAEEGLLQHAAEKLHDALPEDDDQDEVEDPVSMSNQNVENETSVSESEAGSTASSAPSPAGDDPYVNPYVDFTEFIEKIEQAGGEAVVFAEFIR